MNTTVKILGLDGKSSEETELPQVFTTPFRPEVMHKAYVNLYSHSFQKQGRYPAAGEIVSAESRNTGLGIARLARARGEGFPRAGQAAGVAGVRHGRVAHPPESWKNIYKKINKKENRLGLCSAIAATARKDLIVKRGHKVENISTFPLVVSNDIELVSKAKDLQNAFNMLGLKDELDRAHRSKSRTGTARRRGRRKRAPKSILLVIGKENKAVMRLSGSLPGIDIKHVDSLSVLDLLSGSKPIRLTIFSQNAIEQLKSLKAPLHAVMEAMTIS